MKITMKSIKNKVEEFSNSHPNCRNFLQEMVKKAEEEINKEKCDFENGLVFEKAKELCEYDVANFKKSVLPGFKYKLELLKTNDPDYKLLENSIKLNDKLKTEYSRYQLYIRHKIKGLKIYRVVPNKKNITQPSDTNQILLLHGTKAQNVEGILKTGFNPSQKGSYGPGVYLTNSFRYAYSYSECCATEENVIKHFRHFFVNSVPNPEICQDCKPYQNNTSFDDYLKNEPSVKIYKNSRNKSLKTGESQVDSYDSYNRKNFISLYQKIDQQKIALAHHSLVVPAYLIEIEEKTNVDDIIKTMLFNVLEIGIYTNDQNKNKENIANNKNSEFSFTMIAKEFVKEIKANHPIRIDFFISRLENNLNSIMEQLSIQLSSILKPKDDKKRKFCTKLLHENDDDYKLILRSLDKKMPEICQK